MFISLSNPDTSLPACQSFPLLLALLLTLPLVLQRKHSIRLQTPPLQRTRLRRNRRRQRRSISPEISFSLLRVETRVIRRVVRGGFRAAAAQTAAGFRVLEVEVEGGAQGGDFEAVVVLGDLQTHYCQQGPNVSGKEVGVGVPLHS